MVAGIVTECTVRPTFWMFATLLVALISEAARPKKVLTPEQHHTHTRTCSNAPILGQCHQHAASSCSRRVGVGSLEHSAGL